MSEKYDNLVKSFKEGLKKREAKKFGKEDISKIYSAASDLFDGTVELQPNQIEQIRDLWVELADGKIDKGNAMKKLHGTSRAEAIRSVLESSV